MCPVLKNKISKMGFSRKVISKFQLYQECVTLTVVKDLKYDTMPERHKQYLARISPKDRFQYLIKE